VALIHIIDDDLALLRLVSEAITQAGHLVRAHRGISSYLELELDRPPDVIICDLAPAKAELQETCDALAKKGKSQGRVPLLNVTAPHTVLPNEQVLRSLGVVATLHKPPRIVILLELIARAVSAADPLLQRPSESVATMLQQAKKSLAAVQLRHVPVAMRSAPRYDVQFEVSFQSKAEYIKEYTQNISRGGFFVRTDRAPPQGETVGVTLRVEAAQTITVSVQVMHVVKAGEAPVPGFGAKITGADKEALERWHQVIEGIERQKLSRARGPKVMLFGFSAERAADLVRSAGLLCRSELSLVPLVSWQAVLSEASKNAEQKKLFILDATNAEARTKVFDGRLLAELVVVNNVSVAYVGSPGDALVPVGLPVIRAGDLSNSDIIAAIVNWLDLPIRSHLRVPISTHVNIRVDKKVVTGHLLDISVLGVRFVTASTFASNDRVHLSFTLPGGQMMTGIEGEIRWAKPEGPQKTMCGALLQLEGKPAEKAALSAFIESQAQLLRSFDALKQDSPKVEEKVSRLVTPDES
jgi:uncharacterized protein (TIGR02266 family)